MGTAPLPFDERTGCYCIGNCGDWRQPEQRYWVVVPGAAPEFTGLASGVVAERPGDIRAATSCTWSVAVPPPGIDAVGLFRSAQLPIPSFRWQWFVNVVYDMKVYSAKLLFDDPDEPNSCADDRYDLPAIADPDGWGETSIFRVRWYQDTADVPHTP